MSNYYTNTGSDGSGFYNQWQPQQPQASGAGGGGGGGFYSDFDASSTSSTSQQPQQQWMQQPPLQQQQQQHPQQQQQQQPQQAMMYGSQPMPMPNPQATAPLQQQQHPTQPPPAFWNPATAATAAAAFSTGNTNAILGIASEAGKSIFEIGTARMIPGFESSMILLRPYFAVNNQYVVLKMKRVTFPFLSKTWKRLVKGTEVSQHAPSAPNDINASSNMHFELPMLDENAPDLYVPSMSLITYVLLCALVYGNAGKFEPEVIPDVTSKCFLTQILEVLLIRMGFYWMQAPVAILDLFAYTGYKYLGLCLNMVVALAVGHFGLGVTGYYVTFLWTASAASFFMLKTMANNIPTITAATGPKREVMVLAFAASQCATMWFVSQTKFL